MVTNKIIKPGDGVRCVVTMQGAMLINHAYIHQAGTNVCAIAVDMKSKRGEILCDGCDENNSPMIIIEAVKESMHLKKGVKRTEPTVMVFPEFKHWSVWASNVTKYTIYICLVKNKK